jgi:hypothetical protein
MRWDSHIIGANWGIVHGLGGKMDLPVWDRQCEGGCWGDAEDFDEYDAWMFDHSYEIMIEETIFGDSRRERLVMNTEPCCPSISRRCVHLHVEEGKDKGGREVDRPGELASLPRHGRWADSRSWRQCLCPGGKSSVSQISTPMTVGRISLISEESPSHYKYY